MTSLKNDKEPPQIKIKSKFSFDSSILYQKLIENMNEAVWMGDENERTVYANPKFCEMVGYKLEEILGKESYIFWDEEGAKTVREVNRKRKKGVSSNYEGNLVTKSGKKIPVLLSGTPLPDGGTIGIMTDLTELKQKNSMYQKLVEHMNEAVWMGDENERTIYANPKFCEMLEYKLEEIIGEESYIFWDEKSAETVRQVNANKRKKGISSSYEGNLVTKSGKKIPVLLSGTPLPDGGTIGIMTDLTELRQKERTEKVLNTAVQHSTDAIIIFNKNLEISSWNKGSKIIFGYKKEEVIGQNLQKIFSQKTIDSFLQESEELKKFELKAKHKNKRSIYLSITLTPIFEEDFEHEKYYLLIARDITNKAKFEEELTLKYKKIQQAYNKLGLVKRQMDYMFESLELFHKYQDKKSVADFIVSSIIMLTKADMCVLRVFDSKKNLLELLSCFGGISDWESKATIKYKNSLAQKAFELKCPLKIIDIASEPRYQSVYLARKNNLSSLLLIPLTFRSKFIGTISLYARPDKRLEIFENDFIEQYAKLIEVLIGVLLQHQQQEL